MQADFPENRDQLINPILAKYTPQFHPVLNLDLNSEEVTRLDFTKKNPLLVPEDLLDTFVFNMVLHKMLKQKNATVGIGGYLEHRVIYRRSYLFDHLTESRNVHLGIDIWAPAWTAVHAPLDGKVHSFQDNPEFGDYGPTIILEHELEGQVFYTLYGHLARKNLENLSVGQPAQKGKKIADIGPFPENGDWPPHLHFQVITDMQGFSGDFPGVCKPSEKSAYKHFCLDPNLILNCRHLN